jgi:oligopeptide transport system permease protein
MLRYTIIRVIWIFITLTIILSLNFILLKVAKQYPPSQPDQKSLYLTRQVENGYMTMDLITDDTEVYNLTNNIESRNDDWYYIYVDVEDPFYRVYKPVPISVQYFTWANDVVTEWDWGVSTRVSVNTPVFDVLKTRIPVTLRLNLVALIFYIPIGFGLGIWAALKKNKLTDNAISLGVMIFISVPSFVVMTFLVVIFGYGLEWFPKQFPPGDSSTWKLITGMVLPVFGLSFYSIAGLTRLTRAELTEVLTSEFLLLARTKGLTRTQSVIRHAMRNSMVPLVPSIIGSFVSLLSGSVVIEMIYSIPGTGRIFLRAMEKDNYDYNLALGITAFYTIISLFAVLLVDLSYGVVDPRIRMGAKK